ncbi:kinase-like domain-containing protein [Boletus reticuloceps]|uniref:Kinase-like domain-containing protein n=1 Tax=Boletus reticuloceps TaxID=495285 RepID=A0A8I2YBW1_9AGAM|nr:kinase-like domain-containing protein [Boletus reticuloceps]
MTTLGANFPPPPDLTPYIARGDDQYIAGGGFGDVYRRWYHNGSPKEVAVKAFRFTFSIDGDANNRSTKMVRRELGIWRRLNHANVVPFMGIVYGFGMRGAMSLVSLWMHNGSIHRFLEKHADNLSVQHRLTFRRDIADGLYYLHSFPIVHGDLNCNNVLLDADYTARLADFGYASLVGSIPEALTYLQRSTTHLGALRWSPPEQMEPKETFNRTTKSDIYSFGCIALQESQMDTDHQVLSGKPPWSEIREDMAVVLQLARGHKPGRPVSRTLDDAHWGFIQQCWSAIEARPVAGVIVYTMKQFLGQYPTFRSLSDPFLSRSSRDGLGSEPSLSSRLATMGITHPAVDPASVGPSGLPGLPPSITRQAIAPYRLSPRVTLSSKSKAWGCVGMQMRYGVSSPWCQMVHSEFSQRQTVKVDSSRPLGYDTRHPDVLGWNHEVMCAFTRGLLGSQQTEPDSFCQADDSLGRSWAKFMEMLAGDEFDMSAVAPLELGDEILTLAPSNVGCTPDAYDPKVNRHTQNHDAVEQLFSMIAAHHGDESHG